MDYVEFHREPPENVTTMVMAFGGWIDAGDAATGAMRHLIRHLSALRLATIDPEQFFVFTQERPDVRLTVNGQREIRWPRSEFYTWQPTDGRASLLLYRGMEPNQKWRTFTKTFLDVVEQCGVKRIVSIGALLAGHPHTRPPRVTGRSTEPEWQAVLEAWGIYSRPSYQGPTGITTVIQDAAAQRGMSYLSFMGQAPHYLQGTANPSVIQALLSYVDRLLSLGLDVSQLDKAVEAFRAKCDQLVADDPTTQSHIQQLEQEYDSAADGELGDEDLSSEKLMQDLENFLREERGDGDGS